MTDIIRANMYVDRPILFVNEDNEVVSWNRKGLERLTEYVRESKKNGYEVKKSLEGFSYNGITVFPLYTGEIVSLERAKQMRLEGQQQLAGEIAHEFNNPLTTVMGNAQFMLIGERTEDDKRLLESIYGAGDRIRRLVQKAMDISNVRRVDNSRNYGSLGHQISNFLGND